MKNISLIHILAYRIGCPPLFYTVDECSYLYALGGDSSSRSKTGKYSLARRLP